MEIVPENYVSGYKDPWYYRKPERFQEVRSACCKMSPEERLFAQKLSFSGYEREPFFYNVGGRFEEIAGAAGLGRLEDGRSMVRIDFDRDGDEDLLLWNYRVETLKLLRNEAGSRKNFIVLKLRQPGPNTHGIGARITVTAGETRLTRYLNCGEGYLASHPPEVHVGVGTAERVDVEITWPDGASQRFAGLPTRAWYLAEKGAPAPKRIEFAGTPHEETPAAVRPPLQEGDAFKLDPADTRSGIEIFLGSPEEIEELAPLEQIGARIHALPEDVEAIRAAIKDHPRSEVIACTPDRRTELLGASALLPAALVVEGGVAKAKFVGVEAGKRAARWLTSRGSVGRP
jgi:hypothetical protein